MNRFKRHFQEVLTIGHGTDGYILVTFHFWGGTLTFDHQMILIRDQRTKGL